MKPLDLITARRLIDFSGGHESLKSLGEIQLKGAVALHNSLADPDIGFAYLADEVGMGKTYIALGVVALMRYFNPMLRVLYICPSRNVQEKWSREYAAFIRNNVNVSQGRIRSRDGRPAVPFTSCRNVESLIHDCASGYFADYFIGKDSFSISLSDDQDSWSERLHRLSRLVPAKDMEQLVENKMAVKEQYADVLNYILPTFDLVVIDEAHNFKKDFSSSDRNQVLSRVLGFRDDVPGVKRVKRALLLSATPYDRDLEQLRNQLRLVGMENLLPEREAEKHQEIVRTALRRFMVRRLNTLRVNGEELTRNCYRREWRKGERAEINLHSDEQKLVTALVQKKVGDMLARQSHSPSFQTGLLASFESFAESAHSQPVQFDGDVEDRREADAKDRHVLGHIVESYKEKGLGQTLPHPKMDTVVERLTESVFRNGRKHIVFVRRVKSVSELKDKLDVAFNSWLLEYIGEETAGFRDLQDLFARIVVNYRQSSRERDISLVGGEIALNDDPDGALPPKNDTFYAWFFRGETVPQIEHLIKDWTTPDGVRTSLNSKTNQNSILLEFNWAEYLCRKLDLDMQVVLAEHASSLGQLATDYLGSNASRDYLGEFQACQTAFIHWAVNAQGHTFLKPLLNLYTSAKTDESETVLAVDVMRAHYATRTFFSALTSQEGMHASINPWVDRLFECLSSQEGDAEELFRLVNIHHALIGFLMRIGHGIVDLYLSRLRQGKDNLDASSRVAWMSDLVSALDRQRSTQAFSTFAELAQLAEHLELIIKNNVPEILDLPRDEYRRYLSRTLNPVSPIIGASGETGDRSPQARKFRMPGYPLVLVSTDVFQEGEDLHTFCDSVMHYGLSASPISLEQKSGRVDRVSSMAQRRLQSLTSKASDDDFIQVSFPFVRESIESIQVRTVCQNLNKYLDSLHDFVGQNADTRDENLINLALQDRTDIPDQILCPLKSPYVPQVDEGNYVLTLEIDRQQYLREQCASYVEHLVQEQIALSEQNGWSRQIAVRESYEFEDDLFVCLRSAKASGELLLSLTKKLDSVDLEDQMSNRLVKIMSNIAWRSLHRTIAVEKDDRKHAYQLFANAEMLVGNWEITQSEEIAKLLGRLGRSHEAEQYETRLSTEIEAYLKAVAEKPMVTVGRHAETRINVLELDRGKVLEFVFCEAHQTRTQRVQIFQSAGHCVFLSRATADSYAQTCTPQQLVEYTWKRNRGIDLVDFVLSPRGAIFGRVFHPLGNMQWDEFIYCAYTLAVEADLLEYLLHPEDIH